MFGRRSAVYFLAKLLFLSIYTNVAFASAPELLDKVEEGWRYHAAFTLDIKYQSGPRRTIDLSSLHTAMAEVVLSSKKSGKKDDSDTQGLCLIRFTPIIVEGADIRLGETVRLTEAPFLQDFELSRHLPFYELVFRSGFCKPERGELAPYARTIGLKLPDRDEKSGAFGIFPPFEKKEPLSSVAFKFLQRVYIDHELFKDRLTFRYPEEANGTCFNQGNYIPIKETHAGTKRKLEEREHNVKKAFAEMEKKTLTTDVEVATTPKALEALKKEARQFWNNSHANSYSCAEQAGLDFVFDERVVNYLHKALGVEDSRVMGIIVNSHCYRTPCATCSTSLARECETRGIFSVIARSKPTFLFCSCQKHYDRKPPMVSYDQTKFLEGAILSVDQKNLAGRMTQS